MALYRVWMRSTPGFYAQYDGKVDVNASDPEEAIEKAYRRLRQGAFPDRGRNCWKVEKVEYLP
jgi:hypothetical protein